MLPPRQRCGTARAHPVLRRRGVVHATHFAPAADLFNQKHEGVAWRSKPSWYIVASEDRTVHPDLERFVAKRMGATTTELKSKQPRFAP